VRPSVLAGLAGLLLAGCGRETLTPPELYRVHCARCHGAAGEGNPRSLKTYPRLDLRSSPMVLRGDRETVRDRIARGGGPMPGFTYRLQPGEIEALTEFTLKLAKEKD
jgi:mono/diheme cytochrome c family protein